MTRFTTLLLACTLVAGCDKAAETSNPVTNCDINATYTKNAAKPVIADGIYGTVSSMEGNCMPVIQPGSNSCTHCPVSRTLRIHAYTRIQDATGVAGKPGFYQQVSTPLIREITTDADGFYQTALAPGQYSVFILENGMLHASGTDGNGGLNPITVAAGKQKLDLVMRYKASF